MFKRTLIIGIALYFLVSANHQSFGTDSSSLELETRGSYGEYYNVEALSGKYAYVGTQKGLKIFNISDPSSPSLAGKYEFSGLVDNLYVSGGKAYLTYENGDFLILDVTKPSKPKLLGGLNARGFGGMSVSGKKVYLIQDDLEIYNVSKPEIPKLIGSYKLSNYDKEKLTYVCVSGNLAYLGYNNFENTESNVNTLRIVDVSKPSAPYLRGEYNVGYYINKIFVYGDKAYIIGESDNITILNISDPGAPLFLGNYTTQQPTDIFVYGSLAYICDSDSGLSIVDLFDLENPVLLGKYDGNSLVKVYVTGGKAYLTGYAGFFVVDVTNPSSPAILGSYNTVSYATGVFMDGYRAFVANGYGGLAILDVSEPSSPSLIGALDTKGYTNKVFVADNKAYIADSTSGLVIADVTDLTKPVILGTYETPDAQWVCVSGNTAYVADSSAAALYILDVSDPSSPELINAYSVGNNITGLSISDDVVYLSNKAYTTSKGFYMIDVQNPAEAQLLSQYSGRFNGSSVSGSDAYLTVTGGALEILDITDKTSPQVLKDVEICDDSGPVIVSDNKAYFFGKKWTDESNKSKKNGIAVVDVTNPSEAALETIYELGSDPLQIAVSSSTVYVAHGLNGLIIVDASPPVLPSALSSNKGKAGAEITVTGSGFGTVEGKVLIVKGKKEKSCTVISWTDTEIKVTLPSGVTAGKKKIFVENSHGRRAKTGLAFTYLKK